MASSIIYAFCFDSAFFYLNWYLLITGNRATIIPTKLCKRILKDIKYRIIKFKFSNMLIIVIVKWYSYKNKMVLSSLLNEWC